jgi:hypothetical protein
VREDLLMDDEEEFVVYVLLKQLREFLFPLRIFCLSYFALVVFYQVDNVVANVHWGVNERALLV